jgi:hypothetical protein
MEITEEEFKALRNDPVAKGAMVGVLLANKYVREIKDDRPMLVRLDQPVTNGWAAGKLVLTTALTFGAVLAANEVSHSIHNRSGLR